MGIISFTFHANINNPIYKRENGKLFSEVVAAIGGSWIYFNKDVKVNLDDVISYWVKVKYYDGRHTIESYSNVYTFRVNSKLFLSVY